MGCYEVSLGDTLGVGTPAQVRSLIAYLVSNGVPLNQLAGHFHDTYGQALANAWEAYNSGIRTFDSSVGGLGGCPFAPGAKGNVATEDLVYMFQNAGIDTGVDLLKLVETGHWISQQLGKTNDSRAGTALATKHCRPTRGNSGSASPKLDWTLERDAGDLQVYRSGVNLKVVLNRPKNGNALTRNMISQLTEVFESANADPTISRIAITANGKFFCTGMDLGKDSTSVGQGGSKSTTMFELLTKLLEVIDNSPKVTIACVSGPTFGGGIGLAFACDIRISVKSAAFTLSEVKLGLCPATISKYVAREWGTAFTREAMLSARPVAATELKSLGAIAEVADDQERLQGLLDSLLTRLRGSSPGGSRMAKELVRLSWAHAGGEQQAAGIQALFDEMMRPDSEGAYGVKQFQQRRPVDWDSFLINKTKAKL
ncbi:hypothetical protein VTN77DRAFT_4974 [Rasamsonia byssochlamydoides]|uniref:uncharacterized protein n=1 Tax=Rasamsonia byssochlamydoides TaxID=89139 RepID=UPI003744B070